MINAFVSLNLPCHHFPYLTIFLTDDVQATLEFRCLITVDAIDISICLIGIQDSINGCLARHIKVAPRPCSRICINRIVWHMQRYFLKEDPVKRCSIGIRDIHSIAIYISKTYTILESINRDRIDWPVSYIPRKQNLRWTVSPRLKSLMSDNHNPQRQNCRWMSQRTGYRVI